MLIGMVDMKQRVISAFILLTIMIGSILISSKVFGLLMLVFSIIGFNEFFTIKYQDSDKKLTLIKILGIVSLILIALNDTFYKFDLNVVVLIPLLVLSLPIVFYNDSKVYSIMDSLYCLGIVYFLGFSFGNIIYTADTSLVKCIFIFLIAFMTDTYAYIGGMLIGQLTMLMG
jgi:CDP-diglyceride synthetase